MKYPRILTPIVLIVTLLVLFLPGTIFAPRPAAAGSGPSITPGPVYGSCDMARFMGDVTIPDGTSFQPGASFTKTWAIENLSSCTWDAGYSLIFVSGNPMGAQSTVYFPNYVAPGTTVDLSVNMVAPSVNGHYYGYWMLRDDQGVVFGVGPIYRTNFYVDIYVGPATTYYSSSNYHYPYYYHYSHPSYWRYPNGYYYGNTWYSQQPAYTGGVCQPGYWVGYDPYPPYTWIGYCARPYSYWPR